MMTSSQPQSSTIPMGANPISVKPEHITANNVPLTEERFAVLGHEIRNPLSALNAALEAWPSTMDEPQLLDDLLQIMRRQVSQLTRLCNDLLDTGSLAQGKLAICRKSIDLRDVIQNACEEIRPLVNQCRHALTVSLGDSPLTLLGDESKLTQVFANLLHNSSKFTARNGHLKVSLEKKLDSAVIRICDNGRGICTDRLAEIFLPPSASNGFSECPAAGLGIGLRLAKSIVELHGGTIEAFSEGSGLGSTFVVRLPFIPDLSSAEPEVPSPQYSVIGDFRSSLPSFRILVVDDDRSMRFLMSRMLRNLKQSVTVANNGDMAIETILREQPHVVFLDLQMNGMSGYEVAREIRSRTELDSVVLIALSGHADTASRRRAADSGFDQYLVKPVGVSELTEILCRVGELASY